MNTETSKLTEEIEIIEASETEKINTAVQRIKEAKVVKYTLKDSVFTNLFQDKKYLLQLYQTLHPEDVLATEEELKDITLHNIVTDAIYNDLGFCVRDKYLILAEAQSTWTANIIVRGLMYLMTTYQNYFKRTKQNLYTSKKVTMPKPEMYVIFTGSRKKKLEYISLSEEFFGGQDISVDVKVRVLYGDGEDDIISQYVAFTKVYNEQMKLHGRTREAILNAIRICKDKNILKDYLEKCEREVVSIMLAVLDEKEILLSYIESERYEAAEEATRKAQDAAKKAIQETKMRTARETAIQMLKEGLSTEQIVRCIPAISMDDVIKLREESLKK